MLVHGYEEWGDDLPVHLNGMFAFALWDSRKQRLLLARDHLGIKSLYYAPLAGGGLAFASELKALFPVPGWSREIDPLALDWFLATRYIPSPRTIYQGARKLPPAHRLIIGAGEALRIERYWDIPFTPDERSDEREWVRTVAANPHRRRAPPDGGRRAPGGISLRRGGFQHHRRPDGRCIGGAGPHVYRRLSRMGRAGQNRPTPAVAERFGTAHTEIAVEADVAREWPELARHLDEPFADPATLPTWLMARQTRQHVTVVLTGEGADELFQGYGWYGWPRPLPLPAFLARPLRRLVQKALSGRRGRHRLLALLAPDFGTLYAESILSSVSQAEERLAWYRPEWRAHLTAMAPLADLAERWDEPTARPTAPSSWMQELDLKVWLEGDPLTKADRATMLASLEAQVPFLDRDAVELVARIPATWHWRGGINKWLLRQTFGDLLPPEVAHRPKHAFEVPVGLLARAAVFLSGGRSGRYLCPLANPAP